MAEVVLCCEVFEDEMKLAYRRTGCQAPLVWMDIGLHKYPDKLRTALNEKIAELEQAYDTILLGFGLCGNGMIDVGGRTAKLVVPRLDDCARILMCNCPHAAPEIDCRYMYFTEGMIRDGKLLNESYGQMCEKYGPEKGLKIYRKLFKNYTGVKLVDTGAFDLESGRRAVKAKADQMGLQYEETQGTIRILEKLLNHDWDEEFYVLEPGRRFEQMAFLKHPG